MKEKGGASPWKRLKKKKTCNPAATALDPEVLSGEGLAELPVGGHDVEGGGGAAVASHDPEGQWLADQDLIWLPVLSPVAAHAPPPSLRALHPHLHDVSSSGNVGDQDQVEVLEAIDREPDAALLTARNPAGHQVESKHEWSDVHRNACKWKSFR